MGMNTYMLAQSTEPLTGEAYLSDSIDPPD